MALKLARGRLSKGRKIEQPSSAFSYLQTLMHEYEHEVFGVLFLIQSIALFDLKSCSKAL